MNSEHDDAMRITHQVIPKKKNRYECRLCGYSFYTVTDTTTTLGHCDWCGESKMFDLQNEKSFEQKQQQEIESLREEIKRLEDEDTDPFTMDHAVSIFSSSLSANSQAFCYGNVREVVNKATYKILGETK